MKRYINLKRNICILLLMCTSLILFSTPIKTEAASGYTFVVSPSKIYNEVIEIGQTKSFTISTGSRLVDEENEKLKELKFKVQVSGYIVDEFDKKVEGEFVTLSENEITLSPGGKKDVDVKINIPNDFIPGNYTAYVEFMLKGRNNEDGTGIAVNKAVKVPMHLYVGSEEDYNNMDINFDVVDKFISINNERPVKFLEEVMFYVKKLINPFNAASVIKDINKRPYFNVVKGGKNIIDLNNSIYSTLNSVSTESNKESDTKYFTYNKELLNKELSTYKVESGTVILNFEGEELNLTTTSGNAEFIKTQLDQLSKDNVVLTLEYLLENLVVPSNRNYEYMEPVLMLSVLNNSNVPITLNGELDVYKNNQLYHKTILTSPVIKPGKEEYFSNKVTQNQLSNGSYRVDGKLQMRETVRDVDYSFKVENVRLSIIIICIVFLLIYAVLILLLIKLGIKKIRKIKSN